MVRTLLRRLRGGLGNAVVWGASWFAGAFAVFTVMAPDGIGPFFSYWEVVPGIAAGFGVLGVLAGGAFSVLLSSVGAGRLGELRAGRWALAGGVVAGLTIVGLGLVPGLGSLLYFPVITVGLSGVLGAGTAFGTVKLAQRPLPDGTDADRLGRGAGSGLALR
ncbi:MAG TPA: hypothetical protein VLL48_08535 [Longimicrobiales bacterium]|nr:hypothetical protein [Longimicrobiales bacterium]